MPRGLLTPLLLVALTAFAGCTTHGSTELRVWHTPEDPRAGDAITFRADGPGRVRVAYEDVMGRGGASGSGPKLVHDDGPRAGTVLAYAAGVPTGNASRPWDVTDVRLVGVETDVVHGGVVRVAVDPPRPAPGDTVTVRVDAGGARNVGAAFLFFHGNGAVAGGGLPLSPVPDDEGGGWEGVLDFTRAGPDAVADASGVLVIVAGAQVERAVHVNDARALVVAHA